MTLHLPTLAAIALAWLVTHAASVMLTAGQCGLLLDRGTIYLAADGSLQGRGAVDVFMDGAFADELGVTGWAPGLKRGIVVVPGWVFLAAGVRVKRREGRGFQVETRRECEQ